MYFVLKTLIKLMAPFAPFSAEDIWIKLKNENDVESVHLEKWPKKHFTIFFLRSSKVLASMDTVRRIVTLGLEARQKAKIKVRQPLNSIEVISEKLSQDYIDIIKDELNIKNVNLVFDIKLGITKVKLDTKITPELKQEGDYREFVRALQDIRKKLELTPKDVVKLIVGTNKAGEALIQKFAEDLKKTVLISDIDFKKENIASAFALSSGETLEEITIDELVFRVKLEK